MDGVVRAPCVLTVQVGRVFQRLALIIVALCASCEVTASVFERDDRQTDTASSWPVGIVGGEWLGYGSGFLIDRCNVLTARHVVGSGTVIGKRKRFRLQPWLVMNGDNSSRGTVIAAGDIAAGQSEDWAMIRLDKCLGDRFGYFPIAGGGFYTQGVSSRLQPALRAMGFPQDRGRHTLTMDPQCEAKLRTERGLLHDCATMPGASGGPLLAWSGELGRYEAIGIIVAGFKTNRPTDFALDRANVAVDLSVPREAISHRRLPSIIN